ncbi:MAG: phosphoribosylanthranilate isomerase [Bacteroidota bacterium]
MIPTAHPRVKVCCIASVDEAWMAIRAGADALGLVSAMPSGPGVIDEAAIRTIAAAIPPPIATVLLTSLQEPAAIVGQQQRCGTNTIQLCDHVPPAGHAALRAALPGVRLLQVIHVSGPDAIEQAQVAAPHVDALLLDSGNQNLPVKELGGTGRTHDWALSQQIRASVSVPVFLAGGLRAHNVQAAIEAVQPFGLDLCTGVRTDGRLDVEKLQAFFAQVRPGA